MCGEHDCAMASDGSDQTSLRGERMIENINRPPRSKRTFQIRTLGKFDKHSKPLNVKIFKF